MKRYPKRATLLAVISTAACSIAASPAAAQGGAPGGTPAGKLGASSAAPVERSSAGKSGRDLATFFGPGFFGRTTACGTVLGHATIGVAHRTLPCGTRVEIRYAGRRLVVPVIDRGPYATGVTWDLTSGAAQALGFSGRDYVAAATLGSGPVPPR